MKELLLIYFEGCPKAEEARNLLRMFGASFTEVRQDDLSRTNPLRFYTSPTILLGEEIVAGSKTEAWGGCTISLPDANELKSRIYETPDKVGGSKRAGLSFFGTILMAVTILQSVPAHSSEEKFKLETTMKSIEVSDLRRAFNRKSGSVRILSILSPTCHYCQSGHRVVENVFSQSKSKNLAGFIVWLPMMSNDDNRAAVKQSGSLSDERISAEGWDNEREIGKTFAHALNLKGVAWDVYLIYPPGVKWADGEPPPKPKFWMHQLKKESGADPKFCLDASRFSELLNKELATIEHST